jgi:hypothetical protein
MGGVSCIIQRRLTASDVAKVVLSSGSLDDEGLDFSMKSRSLSRPQIGVIPVFKIGKSFYIAAEIVPFDSIVGGADAEDEEMPGAQPPELRANQPKPAPNASAPIEADPQPARPAESKLGPDSGVDVFHARLRQLRAPIYGTKQEL